jgi:hypothetical protein
MSRTLSSISAPGPPPIDLCHNADACAHVGRRSARACARTRTGRPARPIREAIPTWPSGSTSRARTTTAHLPLWLCRTSAEQVRGHAERSRTPCTTLQRCIPGARLSLAQLRDALRYLIVGHRPAQFGLLTARGARAWLPRLFRSDAWILLGIEMVLGGARSSRSAHSQIRTALYLLLLVPRPLPARLVQASAHDAGLALSTANRSSRGARDRVCSNQTAMSSPSAPQMHPIGGPWRGAVDAEPPRHSVCADRRVPLRSRPMECSAVLSTAPVTPRAMCVPPFRRRRTRLETWRTARVGVGTGHSRVQEHPSSARSTRRPAVARHDATASTSAPVARAHQKAPRANLVQEAPRAREPGWVSSLVSPEEAHRLDGREARAKARIGTLLGALRRSAPGTRVTRVPCGAHCVCAQTRLRAMPPSARCPPPMKHAAGHE